MLSLWSVLVCVFWVLGFGCVHWRGASQDVGARVAPVRACEITGAIVLLLVHFKCERFVSVGMCLSGVMHVQVLVCGDDAPNRRQGTPQSTAAYVTNFTTTNRHRVRGSGHRKITTAQRHRICDDKQPPNP